MKEYLKYLIKKRFPVYLSLFISFAAIFVIFNGKTFMLRSHYYEPTHSSVYYVDPNMLSLYTVPLTIVLTLVPIFEFGFKMHRISCEQAYSLPIKRGDLYLARYIIGLFEVLIPFVLAFLLSLMPLLTWIPEYVSFGGFFVYLGLILAAGILYYSIIVFFSCQANNVLDAVFTIVFVMFALSCFMAIMYRIIPDVRYSTAYQNYFGGELEFSVFSLVSYATILGAKKIFELNHSIYLVPLICNCVLGVLCIVGQFFISKTFKSEDAGQKSESYFCYKVMVPILSLGLTCSLASAVSTIYLGVVVIAITYFVFVAHRRSFKFNALTWEIFAGTVLMDLIIMAIYAR